MNPAYRGRLSVCLAVAVVALSGHPVASAQPQVPDLSGYLAANLADYRQDMGYGTGGLRFATPDGLHCTMIHNQRSSWDQLNCTGNLPGAGDFNRVTVGSFGKGAVLAKTDLNVPETITNLDGEGWHETPVDPASYKPLPAGRKLDYEGGTCAVGERQSTTCVIFGGEYFEDHGFTLQPSGSRTF